MTEVIDEQPEDSSYKEIMRELDFIQMIDSGLEDSRQGRVISKVGMKQRVRIWQK
ncbi:MAG: hypothetical protein O3B01_14985 [Planctomycetota bacterium]|nr:hypothetical protein [Planctomycetota bacterium]MDA1139877.1 hypothetical protein [Planctomycetota bacterium]